MILPPESEWRTEPQPPCPCCGLHTEGMGCLGPEELPPDWREREPWASEACATRACSCWGGQDRECEDCWLDGK